MTIPADSRPVDSPGTDPFPEVGQAPGAWPEAENVPVGDSVGDSADEPAGRDSAPVRWLQALALGTIKFYQRFISPLLPSCCRYYPTCSTYSAESFARHGPFVGFWLSFKRILRCNPFFPGGYDPVPPRKPKAGQSPKRP